MKNIFLLFAVTLELLGNVLILIFYCTACRSCAKFMVLEECISNLQNEVEFLPYIWFMVEGRA